ncbi:hypothetical protein DYB31_012636, partial [Aphanomyces astaci]
MSCYRNWAVFCAACSTHLLDYGKRGSGTSSLVKILPARILKSFVKDMGNCPTCHSVFARPFQYKGQLAWKLMT